VTVRVVAILLAGLCLAHAAVQSLELPPTAEIAKAKFLVETFDTDPVGVIILAGGIYQKPEVMAGDADWRDFARSHHLALCSVGIDPSKWAEARHVSYPDATHGAGAMLVKALHKANLADKPWYLFGFREGGTFVNSLANMQLGRIAAWAAHSAPGFHQPSRAIPYGIVSAGSLDRTSYGLSGDYVAACRRQGADVTWVSLRQRGFQRDGRLENFVRDCFAVLLDRKTEHSVIVDNESRQVVGSALSGDAGGTSVLPAMDLVPEWAALHRGENLVIISLPTGVPQFPTLALALRLPDDTPNPRVLAYCYYQTRIEDTLTNVRNDEFIWNKFAADHHMAVITWNTQNLWQNLKSYDQIGEKDFLDQSRTFDAVATAWEVGMMQLTQRYHLQPTGMLLYGCSRGANFAVRLVMREPQRFSAVVAHIANSFDRPVPNGAGVIWAITNGELDPGVANAKRFYGTCLRMGYPAFLRFFSCLGHEENDDSLRFTTQFFGYVLAQDPTGTGILSQHLVAQFRTPAYFADLYNGLVFPPAKAMSIPVGQRLPIPNAEMAPMWGKVIP